MYGVHRPNAVLLPLQWGGASRTPPNNRTDWCRMEIIIIKVHLVIFCTFRISICMFNFNQVRRVGIVESIHIASYLAVHQDYPLHTYTYKTLDKFNIHNFPISSSWLPMCATFCSHRSDGDGPLTKTQFSVITRSGAFSALFLACLLHIWISFATVNFLYFI